MNAETKPHHHRRHARRNLAKPILIAALVLVALALFIGLILLLNSSFFDGPRG